MNSGLHVSCYKTVSSAIVTAVWFDSTRSIHIQPANEIRQTAAMNGDSLPSVLFSLKPTVLQQRYRCGDFLHIWKSSRFRSLVVDLFLRNQRFQRLKCLCDVGQVHRRIQDFRYEGVLWPGVSFRPGGGTNSLPSPWWEGGVAEYPLRFSDRTRKLVRSAFVGTWHTLPLINCSTLQNLKFEPSKSQVTRPG